MLLFRSFIFVLLAGCAVEDAAVVAPLTDIDVPSSARSVWDGTIEGAAAVAFLNDEQTTLDLLDIDVKLDRRAARSLINNRNGKDGIFGTSDDDLYDSVTEIDAAYWVGPSAIGKIIDYAVALGWSPSGDDTLGTWDGVTFTVTEAMLTMEIANLASDQILDDEVPLDRRAVDSILNARPISTVAELSDLYYVGGSALTHLLSYAVVTLGEEDIEEEEEWEEPVACTPSVSVRADSSAQGLTDLLAAATTVDAPFAEVLAFEFTDCDGWSTSDLDRTALVTALFEQTFVWSWSEIGNYVEVAAPVTGGAALTAGLHLSLYVVDEHIEDGDWDPTASSQNADWYASAPGWIDDLTAAATDTPSDFQEIGLYVDLVECSQEAVILIEESTQNVVVLHRFSNC